MALVLFGAFVFGGGMLLLIGWAQFLALRRPPRDIDNLPPAPPNWNE